MVGTLIKSREVMDGARRIISEKLKDKRGLLKERVERDGEKMSTTCGSR